MPRKIPRRLVALSSSAIAAVYFAGLVNTGAAAVSLAQPVDAETPTAPATSTTTSTATPTSPPATSIVVGATATSTAIAPSSTRATAAATYKDGTYAGTGTSRFGNVSVSVTVGGGQITNVSITKVTTSFPVSRIASLPSAVVKNQTASVSVVSGATYSSTAFKQAVQQALAQALA